MFGVQRFPSRSKNLCGKTLGVGFPRRTRFINVMVLGLNFVPYVGLGKIPTMCYLTASWLSFCGATLDLGWRLTGLRPLLWTFVLFPVISWAKRDGCSGLGSLRCVGFRGPLETSLLLSMFSLTSLLIVCLNSSLFFSSENY